MMKKARGTKNPITLRRFLPIATVLLFAVLFIAPAAAGNCDGTHSGTALDQVYFGEESKYTLTAGTYYFTESVTLGQTLVITGDVTLCLNGTEVKLQLQEGQMGSVINVQSGTLTLNDCSQTQSQVATADSSEQITITGGKIIGGNNYNGGGIYVASGATLKMNGGNIVENTAIRSLVDIEGTQEVEHKTTGYGGGVCSEGTFELSGGKIVGNTAARGGGVYVKAGTFTMTGGDIIGNEAIAYGSDEYKGGFGGGVFISGGSTVSISGGTISKNTALERGGGIAGYSLTLSGTAEISHNKVTGSNAGLPEIGGGIALWTGSTLTMNGGTITGNSAANGGGICAFASGAASATTLNIQGGSITKNTATQNGGGIHLYASADTINLNIADGVTISENTATANGGGVYLYGQSTVTNAYSSLTMTGGSITKNTASSGAGVYCDSTPSNTITVSGNTNIKENTNTNVYLALGKSISVADSGLNAGTVVGISPELSLSAGESANIVTFTTAPSEEESAILAHFPRDAVTNTDIIVSYDNSENAIVFKLSDEYAHPTEQHTHDGEEKTWSVWNTANGRPVAEYVILTEDVTLSSTWSISDTVNLCLNGCTITSDIANGRMIDIASGGTLNLYDCSAVQTQTISCASGESVQVDITKGKITGAKNTARGGAVAVTNGGTFNLYSGNLVGNTAERGAGVYVDSGSNFFMYGGSIIGNKGDKFGGGVFNNNGGTGNVELSGGKISYNTALNRGGGVAGHSFTLTGTAEISGNTVTSIEGYTASGEDLNGCGGGVTIWSGQTFTMIGGTISGNSAAYGGGVCVYGSDAQSKFSMSGGTITGNTATQDTGGVYLATLEAFYNSYVAYGNVTISGGSITQNTVAGVVEDVGMTDKERHSLRFTGSPVIGKIDLPTANTVKANALVEGASIGLNIAKALPTDTKTIIPIITDAEIDCSEYFVITNNGAAYPPEEKYGLKHDAETKTIGLWLKSYTVIWMNEGVTETALETDEYVLYGTKPEYNSADPTKANTEEYTYTFAGWKNADTAVELDTETITADTTYTAYYTETPNKYTITFNTDGGTEIEQMTIAYGEAISVTSPEKTGYTFDGWSPVLPETMPAQNLAVKAQWTLNKYTVIWKYDNGTVIDEQELEYNSDTPTIADPEMDATAQYSYTFTRWEPTIAEKVTEDATYVAQFDKTVNTYTVTWMGATGAIETDNNVPYGNTPSFDGTVPTKDDDGTNWYVFDKWDKEIAPVTGDITYTAVFTPVAIPPTDDASTEPLFPLGVMTNDDTGKTSLAAAGDNTFTIQPDGQTAKLEDERGVVTLAIKFSSNIGQAGETPTTVTGTINEIIAEYGETSLVSAEGVGTVKSLVNLTLKDVILNNMDALSEIQDELQQGVITKVKDKYPNINPSAMVAVDDSIDNYLETGNSVELTFLFNRTWADVNLAAGKLWWFHLHGNNAPVFTQIKATDLQNADAENYRLRLSVSGFSTYGLATGELTTNQQGGGGNGNGGNGGGSSTSQGSSVWLTETQAPTPTETAQPTPSDTVPTDVPTTQPTPTETQSPLSVLAVLGGLGAVAVLRRK